MRIGIPKEIKPFEMRVAATPAVVAELRNHGHEVFVQRGAGSGSGIADAEYVTAGAVLVDTLEEVYDAAEMIVKVKEPMEAEFPLLKKGQVLFAFLHLAPDRRLTEALLERGVVGIAYETIQLPDGRLPLLMPMSEVAGRMAVQVGMTYLESVRGGRGVLLGGIPGVPPADVVIIGAGTVGTLAAKTAIGLGARVTIIDRNVERLRYLDDVLGGRFQTLMSNRLNIERAVAYADLLIGAVLVPGARTPRLVTDEMVAQMKSDTVIVDVAIDQGGTVETADHPTTHENPTYRRHGVIHYAVPNMPSAVPRTSTYGLTNATLPYILELANKGYRRAAQENPALALGFNVCHGEVVHPAVAEAHELPYVPLERVIG